MSLLQHAGVFTWTGWIGVTAAGLVSFAGLVGLRFLRRGSARFWASGPALALCALPIALGAGFGALGLGRVFRDVAAIEGLASAPVLAAGCYEAVSPLLLGLLLSTVLVACAFLQTAVGSGRTSAPADSGLVGWGVLASTLVSFAAALGAAFVTAWVAMNATRMSPPDAGTLRGWQDAAVVGGFAVAVLVLVEAVAGAFAVPRGPSGIGLKLVALGATSVCGLLVLMMTLLTWRATTRLEYTALTGLRDGEQPLARVESSSDELPAVATMPPAVESSPTPPAVDTVRGKDGGPSRGSGRAVRVGGRIREPRRIRYVPPSYPDIAKQARVQGVVILEATIGPGGDVTSVTVLRGIPLLDASAVEAVKQWVYEPTYLNGVAVPVIMTVTVNYKLS